MTIVDCQYILHCCEAQVKKKINMIHYTCTYFKKPSKIIKIKCYQSDFIKTNSKTSGPGDHSTGKLTQVDYLYTIGKLAHIN